MNITMLIIENKRTLYYALFINLQLQLEHFVGKYSLLRIILEL